MNLPQEFLDLGQVAQNSRLEARFRFSTDSDTRLSGVAASCACARIRLEFDQSGKKQTRTLLRNGTSIVDDRTPILIPGGSRGLLSLSMGAARPGDKKEVQATLFFGDLETSVIKCAWNCPADWTAKPDVISRTRAVPRREYAFDCRLVRGTSKARELTLDPVLPASICSARITRLTNREWKLCGSLRWNPETNGARPRIGDRISIRDETGREVLAIPVLVDPELPYAIRPGRHIRLKVDNDDTSTLTGSFRVSPSTDYDLSRLEVRLGRSSCRPMQIKLETQRLGKDWFVSIRHSRRGTTLRDAVVRGRIKLSFGANWRRPDIVDFFGFHKEAR